ncbi:hypothetical protein ABW19_dt0200338 [Dactylella cylindrospora]|nr:hypothetical protein ABW19_dt0200338 [Dactylella cylindrospora]
MANHNNPQQSADELPMRSYPKELYTILIVCPHIYDQEAITRLLDEEHTAHPTPKHDQNVYKLGKIAAHNVVIVLLPFTGRVAAAIVAANAWRTFSNLEITLLIGAGAASGAGSGTVELEDVVIGDRVCQWDAIPIEKDEWPGGMGRSWISHRPSPALLQIAGQVHTTSAFETVTGILQSSFGYDFGKRAIHTGVIASGNLIVKNAKVRDEIAQMAGACCFDTESAGLASHFNSLSIRGISNLADGSPQFVGARLNAAIISAAVAKYIISVIPTTGNDTPS